MKEPFPQDPLANFSAGRNLISALFQNVRAHLVAAFHVFTLLLLLSFQTSASPEQDWKKGNDFYARKEYDSAARYFQKIASGKPADPAVYYNLGNTYYRLNNVGLAVLNYERALKRKPDYKEASDNLLLTQARIPGFIQPAQDIFFVRWWKAITAPNKVMLWAIISLLLFICLIGLLVYRKLNKRNVYIRPQYIGALTLLWLMGVLLAMSAAKRAIAQVHAVIIADNVTIPRDGNKGVISIPQGTTVDVQSVKGERYEIVIPDGRSGVVTSTQLAIVD